MYKKTLLSLAVASTLGLTGCFGVESGDDEVAVDPNATSATLPVGAVYPIFDPAANKLPLPNDLIIDQEAQDGSYSVSGDQTNPVIGALNNLSGASTIAPAVIRFNGKVTEQDDPETPGIFENPTYGQNVFLIELKYASGAPVRGLSNQEPPTVAGIATARADVEIIGGTSAIRILPLKPLKPLTRYIALVTNEIEDINGDPIYQSPPYGALTSEEPLSGALSPIQALVNKLWEKSALGFLNADESVNALRTAGGLDPLTEDNIALTYSFTTSGDKDVLKYIANPASWISDQLERSIGAAAAKLRVDAAKVFTSNATGEPTGLDPTDYELPETASDDDVKAAVVAALGKEPGSAVLPADFLAPGNEDPTEFGFEDVEFYVGATLAGFKPSSLSNDLAVCDTTPPITVPGVGEFADKFACTGSLVNFGVSTALAEDELSLETPAVRPVSIDITEDLADITAAAALLSVPRGAVDVHQGSITLPYYLAVPDETQTGKTSTIKTQSWRPNPEVAKTTGDEASVDIPQSDETVSKVHNYNFPFPSKQDDVKVPMLVITPNGMDPTKEGAGLVPVIYQHGITTDRSAALTFGSALVANAAAKGLNIAVFAIDQPLHGISPFDRDDQEVFASLLLKQNGQIGETDEDAAGNIVYASPEDKALVDSVIDGSFIVGVLLKIQAEVDDATGGEDSLGLTDPTNEEQVAAARAAVLDGDAGPVAKSTLQGAITLVRTVANAGSTVPGLAPQNTATGFVEGEINERHFGFTADDETNPIAMDFDEGVGSSGSLFINLSNFLVSRDTLKQGAVDLMNLTATVDSLAGTVGKPVFVGHSLGTLNGGAFVGASTASGRSDLLIGGTHLMTPVAGVTRQLENSPSFAPIILGGLAADPNNLTQGDELLELFLNVNQATLDAVDPMNFADELAVSNVLLSQINGDRTTPNAAGPNEAFVVPEANEEPALEITIDNLTIDSFPAPLSGSEPLSAVMGASATPDGLPSVAVPGFPSFPSITRYDEGVHSLPVLPLEVEADKGDVLKNRTIAVGGETIVSGDNATITFGSLVAQTLALIGQVNAPE